MMVKINGEYLDFNGDIDFQRQVMTIEALDSVEALNNVGDFSYDFDVENTQENRRKLGIESINEANKTVFTGNTSELLSDSGNVIALGSIIVTDTTKISCSFVSGNTNFFELIRGNVRDVDLSQYDVEEVDEAAIVNSWTQDYGIVYPIIDRGGLSNRKDGFLKLLKFDGEDTYIAFTDFQPFVYIKHALSKILLNAGLKIDGDLIDSPTYQSLITTNNSDDYNKKREKEVNVYVGKDTSQTITDAGLTKVTFDVVSDDPFYNSILENWDTINSRWTSTFSALLLIEVNFTTSDSSKLIQFQVQRDGIDTYDLWERGSKIGLKITGYPIDLGSYIEIWAKVDGTTPGSVDLVTGDIKITVAVARTTFAQALLPDQTSQDFIKDIFRLFNVVCTFDSFSKTIHTKFFDNIIKSPEQDLSDFYDSTESETGFSVVSGYAKENILSYNQSNEPLVERYNKANDLDYGNGSIEVNNDFIEDSNELFNVNYVAPYSQYYPFFGLQLIKLNFSEYIEDGLVLIAFTSVTNVGGLGAYNGLSGTTLTNNFYKGTATGNYQNAIMNDIRSSDQILAMYIPNFNLADPIRFRESLFADFDSGGLFRITDSSVPGYNGDWERADFISTDRSTVGLAVFAKYRDGTELDVVKQGLSFGPIQGTDTLTLIDSYYSSVGNILNDPVKLTCNFVMSENEYLNFDFLRPVRLKTKDFNALFYCQKISGYKNSWTPFQMELIKL